MLNKGLNLAERSYIEMRRVIGCLSVTLMQAELWFQVECYA